MIVYDDGLGLSYYLDNRCHSLLESLSESLFLGLFLPLSLSRSLSPNTGKNYCYLWHFDIIFVLMCGLWLIKMKRTKINNIPKKKLYQY